MTVLIGGRLSQHERGVAAGEAYTTSTSFLIYLLTMRNAHKRSEPAAHQECHDLSEGPLTPLEHLSPVWITISASKHRTMQ
jgi:hypothetical protein